MDLTGGTIAGIIKGSSDVRGEEPPWLWWYLIRCRGNHRLLVLRNGGILVAFLAGGGGDGEEGVHGGSGRVV